MSNDLQEQIYKSMDSKSTDTLLEIWQTNNRAEWSDLTFEVIKEILTKRIRISEAPPQNEPITAQKEHKEVELKDWEEKILDDENNPVFYDPFEVINISKWINRFANVFIFVSILFVFSAITLAMLLLSVSFSLKASSHILRILMEMEFNSRQGI